MSARPAASVLRLALAALIGLADAQTARSEARDVAAASDGTAAASRLDALEARIEQLEHELEVERSRHASGAGAGADWTRRITLSGSASTGFLHGGDGSLVDREGFSVRDARFFVDAELGEDIRVGERTWIRNVGFTFEWNLMRLASLANDVGELYVDLQGLGGSPWWNLQVGRFQIPVGEGYLRFSRGASDNPLVTNPVSAPWFWDEGLRLYGGDRDGHFGYVASISDGEEPFGQAEVDPDPDKQLTLKLWTRPRPWIQLSVSGLHSGALGSDGHPASGAFWLGEAWARAFGAGSAVPAFTNGVPVPDGPDELDGTWFLGADAVLERPGLGRLWLAYGHFDIDSSGPSLYDRSLQSWIAELVVEGAAVSPELLPFYLALRASGLGTYDDGEGYLLDFRSAGTIGYNARSLESYSFGLGWRLTRHLTLRFEYTFQDWDLVRGVTDAIRRAADDADTVGIQMGAAF